MGNIRQQDPSLFSHGLVSTYKFPNVQTLLNFASWFVWNKLPFLDKSRKVFLNQYCSDILLRRGFRQHGVIKSVISLSNSEGGWKPERNSMQGKKLFDIAACVLLTQFIWVLQFLYLLCCCEILVTKGVIMFYVGLKVRSSSISLTRIDIFRTPCPVASNIFFK